MSLIRACDCYCHDEICEIVAADWAVLSDKEICGGCLRGEWCSYWLPTVLREPSQMERSMQAIWEPKLREQLNAVPIFRRMK